MDDADELAEAYRLQVEAIMQKEAEKRVLEANDPAELDRLRSLSLLELVQSDHPDIVPALMSRLGPVRACLLYTSPSPRDYAASRMPSSA